MVGCLTEWPGELYEDDPDNPGQQRAIEEPKSAVAKHLAKMYKKYIMLV